MVQKKSNCIAYHYVGDTMAMGTVLITWIKSEDNKYDIMTNLLPIPEKRNRHIQKIMWNISKTGFYASNGFRWDMIQSILKSSNVVGFGEVFSPRKFAFQNEG
jgi:hypothetical protein